ncbi:MAG: hypothetical protein KatS3mg009_0478 [Acidimicrobiia bacterium]|nr:MAG: hypothetical protein KatS3mg009_0478 [Acidimicrobiia bacterium]
MRPPASRSSPAVVATAPGGRETPSDRAERAGTATEVTEPGGDGGGPGTARAEDTGAAATLGAPGDAGVAFGSVAGVGELADAVRGHLTAGGADDGAGAAPAPPAGAESAPTATCATVDAVAGADAVVLTGTAVLGGETVEVTVVERAGRRELVVFGAGCALRARVPLDGGP